MYSAVRPYSRLTLLFALAIVAAFSIALAQSTPVYGGTVTIAYATSSPDLDVQSRNIGTVSETAHYYYETLFDRNPDGQLTPLLATGYTVSNDGLLYTFTLQPNVRFHDGTTFDAEAVKYNLERKINLRLQTWDSVPWQSIEVVDPLTISVSLTAPAPHIIAVLASKTWSMYSPTWAEEVGVDGVLNDAIGTGPFMVEEYLPNDRLVLVKNPDYWQSGLPYLDSVEFRVINDANTRAALLEAREVDIALALPAPTVQRLAADPRFTVERKLGMRQYYIVLNNQRAPTNDVLVRRAINHAVDKQGIIRAVFLGDGAEIATSVYMTPMVDGYSEAGFYAYDPELASELLESAGWTLGSDGVRVNSSGQRLALSFYTRRGATAGDFEIAELVQGMLSEVGIAVELVVLESATFVSAVTLPANEAVYDMVNMSVGVVTGDAEYVVSTFYRTDSAAPKLYNRAYYSNPEVDLLSDLSRQTGSMEERNEIYKEIIAIVFEDAPILQLVDPVDFLVHNSGVHGIYQEPGFGNWPAKYAWKEN